MLSFIRRLVARYRYRDAERDIREELAVHRAMKEHELTGRLPDMDVRAAASRALGNTTSLAEDARDVWRIEWLDNWVTACRRAGRSLLRTPGFLALGVGSLAIALGIATAAIVDIDALRHPTVGMKSPELVYRMSLVNNDNRWFHDFTPSEVLPVLRGMPAIESAVAVGGPLMVPYAGPPAAGISVPAELFDVVGIKPRVGRWFYPGETLESGAMVVSSPVWRTAYHSAPEVDSITTVIGDRIYRIVGVLPQGLDAVFGTRILPLPAGELSSATYAIRMRPGTLKADATAAMDGAARELTAKFGVEGGCEPARPGKGCRVFAYARSLKPDPLRLDDLTLAILGAAIFILLIACANTSALMLARGVTRRRDYALRVALGAGRLAVIRDVVAEVTILTAIGGTLGIVFGTWGIRIIGVLLPASALAYVEPQWSIRVAGALLALVASATAISALLPAWYVTHIHPADPLKDGSPATTSRRARRFQLLIVGELALAMMLLLGSALMARSGAKIDAFDFGYDARSLMQIDIGASVVPTLHPPVARVVGAIDRPAPVEMLQSSLEDVTTRLRTLPNVMGAAWVSTFAPPGGSIAGGMAVADGTVALDSALYNPIMLNVGPGFMETIGLPILEGRDFVQGDRSEQGAVILDERAAEQLFPAGNAVGSMVRVGAKHSDAPWSYVVGIVPHALYELPVVAELADVNAKPVVYLSHQVATGLSPRVVVRLRPGAPSAQRALMAAATDLVPPGASIQPGEWILGYSAQLRQRRAAATIFGILSAMALVLATAGLFGVLSYIVSDRTRDFAIRIALGARGGDIARAVARDALVMVLGGTAVGGLIGLGAAFALYNFLWGVYPVDAHALLTAESVLVSVAMAATVLPAWRATRANPLEVMRAN